MKSYFTAPNLPSFFFSLFSLIAISYLVACSGDTEEVDVCEGFSASVSGLDTEITLEITEGTAPYSYEITYSGGTTQTGNASSNSETITATAFEGATIALTDALSCTTTTTLAAGVLTDPCEELTASASGLGTEITLTITDGIAPYDYVITYTGGQIQSDKTSLETTIIEASVYEGATITITDASSCTKSITLAEEALNPCLGFEVSASASSDNTEIELDITAGVAPFSYEITYTGNDTQSGTTSDSTPDIDAEVFEGATIEITDALGCIATATLAEGELVAPCDDFEVEAVGSDSQITLTIIDGEAPYDYEISYDGSSTTDTGTTSEDEITITVNGNSNATITITDDNGCEATDAVSADDLNSLLDTRDGQRYGIVEINGEFWLSENFNFDDDNGLCYDDNEANCVTYGKLYSGVAATAEGFAPDGWGLPTLEQRDDLIAFLGAEPGTALKEGVFNATFGGFKSTTEFDRIGFEGYFWCETTADDADKAYYFQVSTSNGVGLNEAGKDDGYFSVRLIKQ